MGRSNFQFKQFNIEQDRCAMKVTTDASLFGAWVASSAETVESILDIGAGTGLLSLMLAQASTARVHAVEIEKECFGQLQENISNSIFSKQMDAFLQDIKTFDVGTQYDLIICNPPFHQDQLRSGQSNVDLARHDAGLLLPELLGICSALTQERGSVFILLPYYRKKECLNIAAEMGWQAERSATVRHSIQHEPFRVMFQFSKNANGIHEEEIIIHDERGHYTTLFSDLLRPYYLYL
jgi:tRNA1Val (adenine37-N6)-methyltransferase